MKTNKILAAALVVLMAASCSPKNAATSENEGAAPANVDAKSLLPTRAEIDSVSYLLGINFGSFVKGYNFGDKLNYSQIEKGIRDFINAKGNMRYTAFNKQFRINPDKMNDMFNSFLGKRRDYQLAVNSEKEQKFLAENAKKEGVQKTDSGLQYIIVEPGSEPKISLKDTLHVLYKGTLLDGTVFDETPAGAEPILMDLNRVIPGWREGLQLIGEGGKIKLFIPSNLAYGENGNQGIEPNSTLIFDVEVPKVGRFVAKEEKE